jgi:hypothetical protein
MRKHEQMVKAIYDFFAEVCLSISFCTYDWGLLSHEESMGDDEGIKEEG